MSTKDKTVKNFVDSDEENEHGACGVSGDLWRFSLAVPEPIHSSLLDDSVDNLSMEVHLGGDNSRHPSEISSVSYQNLLDDGEPSSSIISHRGSDDSLDSSPPDFPDADLPPDDLEAFEASDLPLSEHFPMGALQGMDNRGKLSRDRNYYKANNPSNSPQLSIRLKDSQQRSGSFENLKMPERNTSQKESNAGTDDVNGKRSSFEIRNNIPVTGEVKDYEKELNIDFSKVQGPKSTVIGLKQSPGVARRVDTDNCVEMENSVNKQAIGAQLESLSCTEQPSKLRHKKSSVKERETIIEVITPVTKNVNIENEYDYVKYARVQQGNSYVGMRLAYSSSNDSLNIKQDSGDSSREASPEKSSQQRTLSEIGSQEKISEETLTEIPLNSCDNPEDKKAFSLSPENTECDSVEVESVTSEDGNSAPGFPTVEDGLSASEASDADEGTSRRGIDNSPSKQLKSKQKDAAEHSLSKEEEV